MINRQNYKPVLKHEVVVEIGPYTIYKVTDADKGTELWHEVTFTKPATIEEAGRRPFPSEELARNYVISELTHKESIHK